MTRYVLLPGAGTGAANNLIRSLRADYPGLVVVGANTDRFTLRNSKANRNYQLPDRGDPQFVDRLREIVDREQIDLLLPITDADVALASGLRDVLACRVFLPSPSVIEYCQDRYAVNRLLHSRGVAVARTYPVTDLRCLESVFAQLAPRGRAWCRVRRGSSSPTAAPVETAEDTRAWIGYWERTRSVAPGLFTVSEYLPGRDFVCQSVWKAGALVLIKTVERLARHDDGGGAAMVALAQSVNDPRVVETAAAAVRALDPAASGAFSVTLKENAADVPCVTGIDAGRFTALSTLFDATGACNMSVTYVRLALDEPADIPTPYDVAAEESYLVRGVDTLPAIYSAAGLLEGIGHVRPKADSPPERSRRIACGIPS